MLTVLQWVTTIKKYLASAILYYGHHRTYLTSLDINYSHINVANMNQSIHKQAPPMRTHLQPDLLKATFVSGSM